MTRRILSLGTALAVTACLVALVAVLLPTRAVAASPNDEMRANVMVIRGLIDRRGATDFFQYPRPSQVRAGRLGTSWWSIDPWTGARMTPGNGRGHFRYTLTHNGRRYRLVGYLDGGTIVVRGGMPRSIMLAYDHRSEEGVNLIRQYVENWARSHHGLYPPVRDVAGDGAVRLQPHRSYWPSNPWDHRDMEQRRDRGSFTYHVAPDRSSYTLRLHRALKPDYVLRGAAGADPWNVLLTSLEDEILRRSGRILAGFVDQWSLQHDGQLPAATDFSPAGAVGKAHSDWPSDPTDATAMQPGGEPGSYFFGPGVGGTYVLTVHLHSGDYEAGGTAPSPTVH